VDIQGDNVPHLYAEAIEVMRAAGQPENSRNGPVLTIPEPVTLTLYDSTQRVLFDPIRDANPFFHVMEFVWMMAGSNDVEFVAQFNKGMRKYSDDGKTFHAAYGHRWRKAFGVDQIWAAVRMLKANPENRRIVVAMWSPQWDLEVNSKDLPCNTQLMLRVVNGALDMTVINRSNDLIWGSLGANAVHMTMLHELIARAAGIRVGKYRVFTTNLHIYTEMPRFKELFAPTPVHDLYYKESLTPFPLLSQGETLGDFIVDCENFVYRKRRAGFNTRWMEQVVTPLFWSWQHREIHEIMALDWRLACQQWLERRSK
jgi:hypothetical protein